MTTVHRLKLVSDNEATAVELICRTWRKVTGNFNRSGLKPPNLAIGWNMPEKPVASRAE